MKIPLILCAAAALAFSSLTFAQNAQPMPTAATPSARMPQGAQMQDAAEFVREAASGNQMEIQAGQYVAEHSQNAEVKRFAQMLVKDHQDAQQKLKQAAQQAGTQVTDELNPVHKAMLAELMKKTGDELDRHFVFAAIADHHKDILEYTYASQHLNNPQLKQYASQCLTPLQQHLNGAAALAPTIAGVRDATASER